MVSFMGASPRCVDLITIEDRGLLKEVDLVVNAGSLVSKEHLEFCGEGIEFYNSASMTLGEVIKKRVENVAEDFIMVMHNPSYKGGKDYLKNIVNRILKYKRGKTSVDIVKNSGRPSTELNITTLDSIDYEIVDMLIGSIIGNTNSYIKDEKTITLWGYNIK
ncbi:MAG: hypothetical protein WCZ27_03225 [Tissierellaceae bacterium]